MTLQPAPIEHYLSAHVRGRSVAFRYKYAPHAYTLRPGPYASHWQVCVEGDWHRVWITSGKPHLFVSIHGRRVPVTFTRKGEA